MSASFLILKPSRYANINRENLATNLVLKKQNPERRPFVVSRSSFAGHGRGELYFTTMELEPVHLRL